MNRTAHVCRTLPRWLHHGPFGTIEHHPAAGAVDTHMTYGVTLTGYPLDAAIIHDLPETHDDRLWINSQLRPRLAPWGRIEYAPKPPRLRKKWRKRDLLAALGLGLGAMLLLVGCGWHGTGTVTQRDYQPGYSYTHSSPCGSSKARTICYSSSYQPPMWQLRVRDADGHTHDVSVSQHDYDNAAVGSTYTNGE